MQNAITLLRLCLLCVGHAIAKSSGQCPGGCIIASVLFPKRQCICAVPQCSTNTNQAIYNHQATGTSKEGRRRRHARVQGVDCGFCDRDAFTYSSFQACMSADADFRPKGPSIDASVYPTLAPTPGASDAASALSVGPQSSCPPATAAQCQVRQ